MNKKKKNNIIIKLLGGLFVIYIALFIASSSGYYESKIKDKVMVTEDKIKEFEEKVQNGEEIDITAFLNNERIDYSSTMSDLGDNITSGIESFVLDTSKFLGKIFKSLF